MSGDDSRQRSHRRLRGTAFGNCDLPQTCGSWKANGQYGEFRVIQSYFYAGTMLFVDMVRANKQGTMNEVAKGLTFEELNDDHYELDLADVRCSSPADNKITVTGNATPFESERFSFRIELDGASGSYKLTKTRG